MRGVGVQQQPGVAPGDPRQALGAGGCGADDDVQANVPHAQPQPLDHPRGDPVKVGQAHRHQDPLHRLAPPGQRRFAQHRELRAHGCEGGAEQQARRGRDETVIFGGEALRAGVQHHICPKRPIGEIIDHQDGAALGQGPVIGLGQAVVVEHDGVEGLAAGRRQQVGRGRRQRLAMRHTGAEHLDHRARFR